MILRKRCSKCRLWRERWEFYTLAGGGQRADCLYCSRAEALERYHRRRDA